MQKHYTTAQAAKELGISQRMVQYWLRIGERFPNAHQIDPDAYRSPYLIPASDIEAERKRREEAKPKFRTLKNE